jgi:type I restriction-modification system DNA methylase subunit
MADKDKNDNVEHKKKMVEKKANDDFEELIDAAKKKEMNQQLKKATAMLIKGYGYHIDQIEEEYPVPGTNLILDLVVFSEKSIHKPRTDLDAPSIVVEIKDGILLPLHEFQLQEYVIAAKADFGMLYDADREKKLCYTKLDPTATKIIQIADIPPGKSFVRKIEMTQEEELSAITVSITRLFHELTEEIAYVGKDVSHTKFREFEKYLPHILAMKIIDSRNSTNFFYSIYHNNESDLSTLNTIKQMIKQTKHLFDFLDWKELEKLVDIPDSQIIYFDDDDDQDKETLIESAQFQNFRFILSNLWDNITNVTLEKAIHNVLVEYTKNFPAPYKGAEGEFFTPDLLIDFSLKLLYPREGGKLLIADPLVSFLTIKHFLLDHLELRKSSLDNYVRKNITTMSTRKPNSINQFEMMLPEFDLKVGEPISGFDKLGMFDYVFSCGPFGMKLAGRQVDKKEYGDYGDELANYRILNMLKHVNPGGKLALVLPSGFLFGLGSRKKIRDAITKKCYVRAIIQLPPGTFNRYSGISVCLLILEKKGNKNSPDWPLYSSNYKIFMSYVPGQSKRTYRDLTTLDPRSLAKVRYNFARFESTQLGPDDSSLKYADWEQDSLGFSVNYNDLGDKWTVEDKTPEIREYEKMQNPQKLGDVVKSISSSNIQINKINAEAGLGPNQKEINILRIKDLKNGFVKSEIEKRIKLPTSVIDNIRKEFLEDDDIIVSNRGTIGKIAIYKADDRLILPSPQIFVIKADTEKVYPEYLVNILNSKFIQDKLKSLATGAYILGLSKKDLESILIPVPSKKEQKSQTQEEFLKLKEQIEKTEKKLQNLRKKLMEFDI